MELDAKLGWMEQNMMENGKMDKQRDLESLHIQIMMFIMDNFKKTELTVMEYIFIKMVKDMKVIGLMISRKDREKKFYKMDLFMMDILKMEKNGE